MDGSSDIETRHGLVKRRVLYGQIAAGVAVVASALGNAGRSAGWLTSSWSLLVGLIAAVGFLLLGGALVSAWRFNEGLSTDQRLKLSDEFTSFLDDQATRRAALATLAAAGVIAALPFRCRVVWGDCCGEPVLFGQHHPRRVEASVGQMTRRNAGPASDEIENAIQRWRSELGLTQQQLADMTRVTRKTINTIENGHFVPSAVLALRIAAAFGVTGSRRCSG